MALKDYVLVVLLSALSGCAGYTLNADPKTEYQVTRKIYEGGSVRTQISKSDGGLEVLVFDGLDGARTIFLFGPAVECSTKVTSDARMCSPAETALAEDLAMRADVRYAREKKFRSEIGVQHTSF